MDKNYAIFIIGYDYASIFELMDLACDEAYELAKEITDRLFKYAEENEITVYYDTLVEFCDNISFMNIWHDMKYGSGLQSASQNTKKSKGKYYYDVVASICTETCRTDSILICGGFDTEEEAMNYIDINGISEVDYYCHCRDNETAYIEIETRDNADGSIVSVVTVD